MRDVLVGVFSAALLLGACGEDGSDESPDRDAIDATESVTISSEEPGLDVLCPRLIAVTEVELYESHEVWESADIELDAIAEEGAPEVDSVVDEVRPVVRSMLLGHGTDALDQLPDAEAAVAAACS